MDERPSLGSFLRSRRERVRPADVGFPDAGRRRTPGLRREEVATLAGISVDYLVRLEQSRDRRPSAAVLAALCDALRLDDDERAHVLRLAATSGQREMCRPVQPDVPLSPTTVALVDHLHPAPAAVVERSGDLAAWNRAYDRLMRPTGLLHPERPNVVRHAFAPDGRRLYRDWDTVAREHVARLQTAAAICARDERFDAVVRELRAECQEFARLWAGHEVFGPRRGVSLMDHPELGPLDFDVEVLLLPDRSERRVVVYVAAGEATAEALDCLLSQPGLQAV